MRNNLPPGVNLPGGGINLPPPVKPSLNRLTPNPEDDDLEFEDDDLEFEDEEDMGMEDVINNNMNKSSNRDKIGDMNRRFKKEFGEEEEDIPIDIELNSNEEMPRRRERFNKRKEAEEFLKNKKSNSGKRPDTSDNDISQREGYSEDNANDRENFEEIENEPRSRGNRRANKKNETNENPNSTKTTPLNFLQSIFLMILSGVILFLVIVYGWGTLSQVNTLDIFKDITRNVGVLNGDSIEPGENKTWDLLHERLETENIIQLEVPYTYDKKSKTVRVEYGEYKLNINSLDYDIKFKKKGTLLVEIIEDYYGDLISYTIIDII